MDARAFGRAYPAFEYNDGGISEERAELLRTPRQWMGLFNAALAGYLHNRSTPDEYDFRYQLDRYSRWTTDTLPETKRRLDAQGDQYENHRSANELGFHSINASLLPLWPALFYRETISESDLTDMQLRLAYDSFPSIVRQRRLRSRGARSGETMKKESARLAGHGTEVDAMIANLELMKTNPELITLSAPSRYEANPKAARAARNRNSDALVIHRRRRQVIGQQVKTSLGSPTGSSQHYDDAYVLLIDGEGDLGNTRYINGQQCPRPGLLALGLLATHISEQAPAGVDPDEYARRCEHSARMTQSVTPFLSNAAHAIDEKLQYSLERGQARQSDQPLRYTTSTKKTAS